MQIPSASGLFGLASSRAASNANAADVVQQFLDYAKMDPIQRLRANILKSMGLTEDDLKNMTLEQQKAVEQNIEQLTQEQLKKNVDKPGQVVDVSA